MDSIEKSFCDAICSRVSLVADGRKRFRVVTPFVFNDGDHLVIVLKEEGGRWVLSDEGHTYMHLSLDLDERELRTPTRRRLVRNALSFFGLTDRGGELVLAVDDGDHGGALFSFVQAVLKITDVTYLAREHVVSTFIEDFERFISDRVPKERRTFGWHDPQRDPGPRPKYRVDCRINGSPTPLFAYALPSDNKTQVATISLLRFETWGLSFCSLGVFEDSTKIDKSIHARFMDVIGKEFSSLGGNEVRIEKHLREAMGERLAG